MTRFKVFDSMAEANKTVPQGQMVHIKAGGKDICLAHTQVGFFAIQQACPHLGQNLSEGHLNYLNEIICPWHSYRFNLETGEECQQRGTPAETYPVVLDDEGLFVEV